MVSYSESHIDSTAPSGNNRFSSNRKRLFCRGRSVVSRCANPSCDARFKYLREGRLFQFRATNSSFARTANNNAVELWWLCARCCLSMTLVEDGQNGVKLAPLPHARREITRADLDLTGSD